MDNSAFPPRKRQRLFLEPDDQTTSQSGFSRPNSQSSQRSTQTEQARMDRLKAITDALDTGKCTSEGSDDGKENLSLRHTSGSISKLSQTVRSAPLTPRRTRTSSDHEPLPHSPLPEDGGGGIRSPHGTGIPPSESLSSSFGFAKASSSRLTHAPQTATHYETEKTSATQHPSSSPDIPKENNEDEEAFFQSPGVAPSMLGFRLASFAAASSFSVDAGNSFSSAGNIDSSTRALGFSTASSKGILAPSAAALAKAERMRKHWEEEDSSALGEDEHSEIMLPPPLPSVGFSTASSKGVLMPSAAALEKARHMREEWERDMDEQDTSTKASVAGSVEANDTQVVTSRGENISSFETPSKTPALATASSVANDPTPSTPTPTGSMPSRILTQAPPALGGPLTPSRVPLAAKLSSSLGAPGSVGFGRGKAKPFKSPFLPDVAKTSNAGHSGSPLNPHRHGISAEASDSRSVHPFASSLSISGFSTPPRPSASFELKTPQRTASLGVSVRRTGTPAANKQKFKTPFKPGMAPGQPGRTQMVHEQVQAREQARVNSIRQTPSPAKRVVIGRSKQLEKGRFFNLTPQPGRSTLQASGLIPQAFGADDLEDMGINVHELSQITPETALFYSFHSSAPPSPTHSSTPMNTSCGPSEALRELLHLGCSLATKAWVDNHWILILWKLAGIVCLDPHTESDPARKRWSWSEVMRQLRYRYERELEGGSRPPLRLITTQDAPPTGPMVLCISGITWTNGGETGDGFPRDPQLQLELTDGWYRLRAEVDAPIARAVKRGVLCLGRKLAVAGARLVSSGKDGVEVLDAYDKCHLRISGNSAHLAPWHAKLGFQREPFVAGLTSLTGDGGVVAVADLTVVKAYPIAYIEFIEDEVGNKRQEGPRDEKEEAKQAERWTARRNGELTRLRGEMEKQVAVWERYIDRLERRAGARFAPTVDDSPPDHIEDLFDDLENVSATEVGSLVARLSHTEAGWLARFVRERCSKERETFYDSVQRDLRDLCPPRDVRSFRVLVVEDARQGRRTGMRRAQLTVWDVLSISFCEGGKPGAFQEGQRFLVTNLVPKQPRAWMPLQQETSEIYLATRRDTRWRKLN